jgi:hypothetical protein
MSGYYSASQTYGAGEIAVSPGLPHAAARVYFRPGVKTVEGAMSLKRWLVVLLGSVVSIGLAYAAEEKKEEKKPVEKKEEKKKEEKKEEKKAEKEPVKLPEAVSKAFNERFKTATDVRAAEKKEGYEIKAKDQWNSSIKVVYTKEGKLLSENERKLPLANVPAAVVAAAKKWAAEAKWDDLAEVETKKGAQPVYSLTGVVADKKVEVEVNEDGTLASEAKAPEKKAEKKEEKKQEKKEEKKPAVKKEAEPGMTR